MSNAAQQVQHTKTFLGSLETYRAGSFSQPVKILRIESEGLAPQDRELLIQEKNWVPMKDNDGVYFQSLLSNIEGEGIIIDPSILTPRLPLAISVDIETAEVVEVKLFQD